ncbi:hypothetical protein M2451_003316 [Dysgonomonas sp. PFB1-18]|uniref:hypothetical protein n=1 Tax=unclassified Dysgonomonas TaxID=2630389 RepID=UPI00247526BC|nr:MULTISPECIES: hypothetical protein [unclassified Dysgonomonas]MDH6310594.1 hypothetical protein [Dysgonomonas sp. PF1-14]MDH6340445.1 hypothetical protein [Dysgonomonas sp. PF1-16]MDH6381976.1 hypothetical protein [Dysgonomonas sp. PFB1-18]MDH6399415.1 hypothetical protein [Dysgonomonas sp. PF1-23]
MKGSVIINGTDISDFGALILRGGDYDFLPFPARVEPKQNNWHEHDGLDVDLTEVYFKERSLSVQFYISNGNSLEYEFNLNSFYGLIATGYIDLYSREFARTFRMRYLSVADYKHKGGLYKQGAKQGWVKVNFSMDDPLQLFTDPAIRVPASSKNYPLSGVLLNGYDLAQFGIVVNECYSSMLAQAAVKAPLTRKFAKYTGLLAYPNSNPTFEAKEITIKCTMAANSLAEFYHNYEALFNHVSQTGELLIETYLGGASCYYLKMENFKKHGVFARGVMVSFTLRFMQLDTGLTTYVLGAEDGSALLTEDNEYIEITK